MKVIVGCDGYNADQVADAIVATRLYAIGPETVYQFIAEQFDFGCSLDRAVLDKDGVAWHGEDDLPESYRETFHLPTFNPRLMPDGGGAITAVREIDPTPKEPA